MSAQYQACNEYTMKAMLDIEQPKQVYQLSTIIYQAYKDNNKESKQYITQVREISNYKHERFVSRFEQLALRPCLHRNEGYSHN